MALKSANYYSEDIPEYLLEILLEIALHVSGGESGSVMLLDKSNHLRVRCAKVLKARNH